MMPDYRYSPSFDCRRTNNRFPPNFKKIPATPRKNTYTPSISSIPNTIKNNNNSYSQKKPNSFYSNNIEVNNSFPNYNKQNCETNKEIKEKTENSSYEQFFEIFGIKLYFDDLLILALIFFLYKEEVNDNYLYIILFMLLLS